MRAVIFLSLIMIGSSVNSLAQPYSGTVFIDPDIITSSDPSSIQSTSYTGQGTVIMYDRRVSGWVTVNAYLFDVVWDDGLTSVAQVNPEFGTISAATIEAEKYAFLIGQLPTCLREDVNEIWIHKGIQPFGGGNKSILIHAGQSTLYENDGIIEEALVHEASHTSLDAFHAAHSDWINAQNLDGSFISTYAQSNPTTEDIAESYLTWLAVRYRQSRISVSDYDSIVSTIPNRLAYFDSINCNLYPFDQFVSVEDRENQTFKIYPNLVTYIIHVNGVELDKNDIKIYDLLGRDITYMTSYTSNKLNVSDLPTGYYFLRIKTFAHKVYKQ
jgi:Secretion system C-terminal sorting domain